MKTFKTSSDKPGFHLVVVMLVLIVGDVASQDILTVSSGPEMDKSIVNKTNLSFQFYGGFQLFSAQRNDIKNSLTQSGYAGTASNWLFGGTTTYPVKHHAASFLDFSLEIKLKDKHRIAFTYTTTNTFGARGITGLAETGKKKAMEFYYLFVPNVYVPNKFSKWETSAGIGPSINFLEVKFSENYYIESSSERNKFGLSGQFSCSYYLTPNLSAGFKFSGRLVPGITIPESSHLKEHKVNFSSFDVAFGIGLHL